MDPEFLLTLLPQITPSMFQLPRFLIMFTYFNIDNSLMMHSHLLGPHMAAKVTKYKTVLIHNTEDFRGPVFSKNVLLTILLSLAISDTSKSLTQAIFISRYVNNIIIHAI
jgi:hypothetical protein